MADILEEKNLFLTVSFMEITRMNLQQWSNPAKNFLCVIRDIITMNPQLNMRFLVQKFMTVLGRYRLLLISLTSVYQLTHDFVPYSLGPKKKKKSTWVFLNGMVSSRSLLVQRSDFMLFSKRRNASMRVVKVLLLHCTF